MSDAAHAIVVLGASVIRGRPLATLRARLDTGRRAFERGIAPRLIVTGRGEAEPMRRYLLERGVPADAILVEDRARTTHENACRVAALVPAGARIILVTQRSHQLRAQALFAAQGLRPEPLMPEERFSLYRSVRERIALLHHRWKGWV